MTVFQKSRKLFRDATKVIPGGVNSPVRAFRAVGSNPIFIDRAKGPYLYDADGNKYIDYCLSWGPMILGHAHAEVLGRVRKVMAKGTSFGIPTELETHLAKMIVQAIDSVEKVRLVSSGTEAVMTAIRLARGCTGRDKIKYQDQIAAVIVEPIAGNMGVVPSRDGFLRTLRKLCTKNGSILIFDEVITGFRIKYGSVQDVVGVKADLTCLGKIIGGGFPIGACGGRAELMDRLAPTGQVYQAGTLSGNPVCVAAGIATLKLLKSEALYPALDGATETLCDGIQDALLERNVEHTINRVGSMFTIFFNSEPVTDYASAVKADTQAYARFHRAMLGEGIYLPPSQFEACFLSTQHKQKDIDRTIMAARTVK